MLAVAVLSMAVAMPSIATAQPPGTDPPPNAPSTSAPPPTEPPASTTTTSTVPTPDGEVPVQPPISDGSEIPDPPTGWMPVVPPGTSPGAAPSGGAAPGGAALAPAAVELERRRIALRMSTGGDAVTVARAIEAEASAEMGALTAELDAARRDYDEADRARRDAEASAQRRRAEADRSASASSSADAALQEVAVAMYVDPPQELVTAAALSGELDQRLAAQGLLAARSDLAHRAARTAVRSERRAAVVAERARDAADEATAAAAVAQGRLADLERRVAERADRLRQIAVTVEALRAEAGGLGLFGGRLLDRLSVEQVTHSGSVVVTVEPDGAWSVEPVGFPPDADIVRIPGTTIRVHRLIAANVAALVEAARVEGVRLDGWGHRDALRQIELRRSHCGGSFALIFEAPAASCRPPTARPGRSMHERGLAVDFANCSTRATPCYQWLSVNAGRFGLLNLPSEPWHWSTNGR
jgi:hypothetical protein